MLHCCGCAEEDVLDDEEHHHPAPMPTAFPIGSTDGLVLTHVAEKSRCLVAAEPIAAGTTLEISPTVALSAEDCRHIDESVLYNYYFEYITERGEKIWLMVMGLTSLCNHADEPNAVKNFIETPVGVLCELRTLRNIAVGEEITLNYGVPLWFTPHD